MSTYSMGKQHGDKTLSDLRDLNLNFLLLAQKMLLDNRLTAKSQLGLSDAVADRLLAMGTTELLQLANSSMSLCTLRFDDAQLLTTATQAHSDPRIGGLHASILGFKQATRNAMAG
ncbi:MAG TPA: flagellar transcriptional regulator FlhD [Limnobacter sp.]|nr:flagellar transcriptional regulator FlhD [Limnobacter sp.]